MSDQLSRRRLAVSWLVYLTGLVMLAHTDPASDNFWISLAIVVLESLAAVTLFVMGLIGFARLFRPSMPVFIAATILLLGVAAWVFISLHIFNIERIK